MTDTPADGAGFNIGDRVRSAYNASLTGVVTGHDDSLPSGRRVVVRHDLGGSTTYSPENLEHADTEPKQPPAVRAGVRVMGALADRPDRGVSGRVVSVEGNHVLVETDDGGTAVLDAAKTVRTYDPDRPANP